MDKNFKLLIGTGFITWLLYLLFFAIEPLKRMLGETTLALKSDKLYLLVFLILIVLFISYILAARIIEKSNKKMLCVIFSFAVLFNLTLLFIIPNVSTDIYYYIKVARVFAIFHQNPYIFSYNLFTNDMLYGQLHITQAAVTSYGPLFTLITSLLSIFSQSNVLQLLLTFKSAFVAINLANILLIHKVFKNNLATFLYSWNPLILFEFCTNGHNDVLMIFFLLCSLLFILKNESAKWDCILSALMIVCSILVKYITIIFLPIYLIFICKTRKNKKERLFIISMISALAFLILLIAYLPFYTPGNFFQTFLSQTHVSSKIFTSPVILCLSALLSEFDIASAGHLAKALGFIIFSIFYIVLLAKIGMKQDLRANDLILYYLIALSLFFLCCFSWFMPWYLTTLITLLACYYAIEHYLNDQKKIIDFKYILFLTTLYGICFYIVLR